MLKGLWNVLLSMAPFLGLICFVGIFFLVICIASAPKDRTEEDAEQMNFLKNYFNRKDDNND